MIWLLRTASGREVSFTGSELAAAVAAQDLASQLSVSVTYRRKLDTQLALSEAPTARMKRP